MSELIVLDRTVFAAAQVPCPFGKNAMLKFCTKERIPVQLTVTRGKGQAPVVLKSDWEQWLKSRQTQIPALHNGHSAESEFCQSVLRRLTRIEEQTDMILSQVTDLLNSWNGKEQK